jgi:hypothetical protein
MNSSDYRGRVPVGWPGNISRRDNLATEPRRVGATPPAAYGLAVKVNAAGEIIELPASSAAGDIYGLIIGPEFSTFTPKPEANIMGDVMRQGYMTVKVASGTVAANGAVYVRISNASAGHPLGEINAAAVTESSTLRTAVMSGARFVGPSTPAADGTCIAEIALNI